MAALTRPFKETAMSELVKRLQQLQSKLDEMGHLKHLTVVKDAISALAAQQSQGPVAWIVTIGGVVNDEQKYLSWEKPSYRPNVTPLYTAPQSGVREGMLRAAEICDAQMIQADSRHNHGVAACRNAITRAADQVNAEGQASNVPSQLSGKGDGTPSGSKKETILNDSAPAHSAPPSARQPVARQGEHNGGDYDMKHSASQPDTVAMPSECCHDWRIWPETDGYEQRCSKCNAYRNTPQEVRDAVIKAEREAK